MDPTTSEPYRGPDLSALIFSELGDRLTGDPDADLRVVTDAARIMEIARRSMDEASLRNVLEASDSSSSGSESESDSADSHSRTRSAASHESVQRFSFVARSSSRQAINALAAGSHREGDSFQLPTGTSGTPSAPSTTSAASASAPTAALESASSTQKKSSSPSSLPFSPSSVTPISAIASASLPRHVKQRHVREEQKRLQQKIEKLKRIIALKTRGGGPSGRNETSAASKRQKHSHSPAKAPAAEPMLPVAEPPSIMDLSSTHPATPLSTASGDRSIDGPAPANSATGEVYFFDEPNQTWPMEISSVEDSDTQRRASSSSHHLVIPCEHWYTHGLPHSFGNSRIVPVVRDDAMATVSATLAQIRAAPTSVEVVDTQLQPASPTLCTTKELSGSVAGAVTDLDDAQRVLRPSAAGLLGGTSRWPTLHWLAANRELGDVHGDGSEDVQGEHMTQWILQEWVLNSKVNPFRSRGADALSLSCLGMAWMDICVSRLGDYSPTLLHRVVTDLCDSQRVHSRYMSSIGRAEPHVIRRLGGIEASPVTARSPSAAGSGDTATASQDHATHHHLLDRPDRAPAVVHRDDAGASKDGLTKSAQLQPQPDHVERSYATMLHLLRGYRMNPHFWRLGLRDHARHSLVSASQRAMLLRRMLLSRTYTHAIDPHRPLCPYDLHGVCNDPKCSYQHQKDYTLGGVDALFALAGYTQQGFPLSAVPSGSHIEAIVHTVQHVQALARAHEEDECSSSAILSPALSDTTQTVDAAPLSLASSTVLFDHYPSSFSGSRTAPQAKAHRDRSLPPVFTPLYSTVKKLVLAPRHSLAPVASMNADTDASARFRPGSTIARPQTSLSFPVPPRFAAITTSVAQQTGVAANDPSIESRSTKRVSQSSDIALIRDERLADEYLDTLERLNGHAATEMQRGFHKIGIGHYTRYHEFIDNARAYAAKRYLRKKKQQQRKLALKQEKSQQPAPNMPVRSGLPASVEHSVAMEVDGGPSDVVTGTRATIDTQNSGTPLRNTKTETKSAPASVPIGGESFRVLKRTRDAEAFAWSVRRSILQEVGTQSWINLSILGTKLKTRYPTQNFKKDVAMKKNVEWLVANGHLRKQLRKEASGYSHPHFQLNEDAPPLGAPFPVSALKPGPVSAPKPAVDPDEISDAMVEEHLRHTDTDPLAGAETIGPIIYDIPEPASPTDSDKWRRRSATPSPMRHFSTSVPAEADQRRPSDDPAGGESGLMSDHAAPATTPLGDEVDAIIETQRPFEEDGSKSDWSSGWSSPSVSVKSRAGSDVDDRDAHVSDGSQSVGVSVIPTPQCVSSSHLKRKREEDMACEDPGDESTEARSLDHQSKHFNDSDAVMAISGALTAACIQSSHFDIPPVHDDTGGMFLRSRHATQSKGVVGIIQQAVSLRSPSGSTPSAPTARVHGDAALDSADIEFLAGLFAGDISALAALACTYAHGTLCNGLPDWLCEVHCVHKIGTNIEAVETVMTAFRRATVHEWCPSLSMLTTAVWRSDAPRNPRETANGTKSPNLRRDSPSFISPADRAKLLSRVLHLTTRVLDSILPNFELNSGAAIPSDGEKANQDTRWEGGREMTSAVLGLCLWTIRLQRCVILFQSHSQDNSAPSLHHDAPVALIQRLILLAHLPISGSPDSHLSRCPCVNAIPSLWAEFAAMLPGRNAEEMWERLCLQPHSHSAHAQSNSGGIDELSKVKDDVAPADVDTNDATTMSSSPLNRPRTTSLHQCARAWLAYATQVLMRPGPGLFGALMPFSPPHHNAGAGHVLSIPRVLTLRTDVARLAAARVLCRAISPDITIPPAANVNLASSAWRRALLTARLAYAATLGDAVLAWLLRPSKPVESAPRPLDPSKTLRQDSGADVGQMSGWTDPEVEELACSSSSGNDQPAHVLIRWDGLAERSEETLSTSSDWKGRNDWHTHLRHKEHPLREAGRTDTSASDDASGIDAAASSHSRVQPIELSLCQSKTIGPFHSASVLLCWCLLESVFHAQHCSDTGSWHPAQPTVECDHQPAVGVARSSAASTAHETIDECENSSPRPTIMAWFDTEAFLEPQDGHASAGPVVVISPRPLTPHDNPPPLLQTPHELQLLPLGCLHGPDAILHLALRTSDKKWLSGSAISWLAQEWAQYRALFPETPSRTF